MQNSPAASAFQPIAQGCSEYLLLLQSSATAQEWSAPGIELGYFQAKEMMEPTLIRWITNICAMHSPFLVDESQNSNQNRIINLGKQFHLLDDFLIANGCPGFYGIQLHLPNSSLPFIIDRMLLVKKRGASEDALLLNCFSLQASSEAA